MKADVRFDDLICRFCRYEKAPQVETTGVDYTIAHIIVKKIKDGDDITVPIDIRDMDAEYHQGGQFAVRLLARVPCPSCGADHSIDISSIRRAPTLRMLQIECPKCYQQSGKIVGGPIVRYREKEAGDNEV